MSYKELSNTTNEQITEKIAVPKTTAIKKTENTLSPVIFTKKMQMIRREPLGSRRLLVFENILGVVTQAYYKKSYEIETTVKELKLDFDDAEFSDNSKNQGRRVTRTKRRKIRLSLVNGTSRKPQVIDNEEKREEYYTSDNILDYLVSPLKVDYPYGNLIRNVEFKRNSHFRDLHLRFWKKIQ